MIKINGKSYEGSNITIVNNTVIVDGKVVESTKGTNITVEGNITLIRCDKSLSVNGDVNGETIHIGGSLSCDDIVGNVDAGGSVNCDDIKGNVRAGGSINADKIFQGV